MVCRDQVDRSVLQPFYDRLPVLIKAQRRIHLGKCPVLFHRFLCQRKMMRRCLRMNIRSFRLCPAHQFHPFLCADMLDIDTGSGL